MPSTTIRIILGIHNRASGTTPTDGTTPADDTANNMQWGNVDMEWTSGTVMEWSN